jgi:hypothetical protein
MNGVAPNLLSRAVTDLLNEQRRARRPAEAALLASPVAA